MLHRWLIGNQLRHFLPVSGMSEVKFCEKKDDACFTFLVRAYIILQLSTIHQLYSFLPSTPQELHLLQTSSSIVDLPSSSPLVIIINHWHALPLRTPSSTAHSTFHCSQHLSIMRTTTFQHVSCLCASSLVVESLTHLEHRVFSSSINHLPLPTSDFVTCLRHSRRL